MYIAEQEKYYLIKYETSSGVPKLLCQKPMMRYGTALGNVRQMRKHNKSYGKSNRGEVLYKNIKIIELDILHPEKSEFCDEQV